MVLGGLHRGWLLTALGLLLLCPMTTSASGISATNVGSARSGPVTVDPAAVYWNPSLLGELPDSQALLGVILNLGDVSYRRERHGAYQWEDSFDFSLPIATEAVDASKTGTDTTAEALPFGPAPSLFAGIHLLDDQLVAGLGVYAPYIAMLSFDREGPQRWALTEATIVSVFVTPAIAWRIHDRISLGVGVSYVSGLAEFTRTQDFAGVAMMGDVLGRAPINQGNDFGPDAPTGVRELEVMSRKIAITGAWAHSLTFNAGITLRPTDGLRLGLSYQHLVDMDFLGEFALDMNNDFFTTDLASQGLQFEPLVEGDASISLTLPSSIRFGAAVELTERIGLTGVFEYTFWSMVEVFEVHLDSPDLEQSRVGLPSTLSVDLERNWQDTVALELALRYRPSDTLGLWIGGGYQSAASPDETVDVASLDGDRLIGNLGAEVGFSERLSLVADFEVQGILPRTVVASESDLGNGVYELMIYALGLHLQVGL